MLTIFILTFLAMGTARRFSGSMEWFGSPVIKRNEAIISARHIEIAWKVPRNTGFVYTTELYWCEYGLDRSNLPKEMLYYPAEGEIGKIHDILSRNSSWTNCSLITLKREINYKFTSLKARNPYRFRVRNRSPFGDTPWSPFEIISTHLEDTLFAHERVTLRVRGTGSRNHETAQIKVDNNLLMEKGNYRGLYLSVLNRRTMK